MDDGEIVGDGPTADILADDAFLRGARPRGGRDEGGAFLPGGAPDTVDRRHLERREPVRPPERAREQRGNPPPPEVEPATHADPRHGKERLQPDNGGNKNPARDRQADEERDRGEREERAAERLGEAGRVWCSRSAGAETGARADQRPAPPGKDRGVPNAAETSRLRPTSATSQGRPSRNASARARADTPAPKRWPRGSMKRAGGGVRDTLRTPGRAGGGAIGALDHGNRGEARRGVSRCGGPGWAAARWSPADARRRQAHHYSPYSP